MSTLGEHQGNGIRYTVHLSAQGGAIVQMLRRDDGGWVAWEDYARLQAEVEQLRSELADAQENYHLVNEMVTKLRKERNR